LNKSPLKDLPREVRVLVIASFFVAIGFGIVVPAIPVFARSFGVSHTQVGFIISTFAVARFASGLFSGKLVDRFGERNVFAVGVFFVSISVALAGLAQSYEQLLIFRAAGGLGSSMFSVAAGSVILRSVSDNQRGQAQSVYNGAFLLGGMAGPAIGGALTLISLRAPFFTYAITLLISGTIGFFFLTSEHLQGNSAGVSQVPATKLRDALALSPYRVALFLSFATSWVLFGLRSSVLPLFITEDLGSTAAVVGYGFTISAIFQGVLLLKAGRISDIRGRRFAAVMGSSIVVLGVLILVFTVNPWMYIIAMAILGLGGSFLGTTPANIVGDVIKGKGGQVIALFQMAGDAGMMVGPIVVGLISDHYGYQSSFVVSALVMAIALGLAMKLPETRNSRLG
jgi:MFS family permease